MPERPLFPRHARSRRLFQPLWVLTQTERSTSLPPAPMLISSNLPTRGTPSLQRTSPTAARGIIPRSSKSWRAQIRAATSPWLGLLTITRVRSGRFLAAAAAQRKRRARARELRPSRRDSPSRPRRRLSLSLRQTFLRQRY